MSAVRISAADDGTFVLAIDSHAEQMYVTAGMSRTELEQLAADLHRCVEEEPT